MGLSHKRTPHQLPAVLTHPPPIMSQRCLRGLFLQSEQGTWVGASISDILAEHLSHPSFSPLPSGPCLGRRHRSWLYRCGGGGVSGMILGSLMIQGGCGKGRSRAAGGLRSRSSHTWTSWCSPKFKSALMSADPRTPQACSSQCWDKLVSVWFSYMCPE